MRPDREWWLLLVWFGILMYEGAYTKKFTFWDEVKLLWKTSFFSTLSIFTIVSLGQFYTVSRIAVLLIGLSAIVFFPLLRVTVKRSLIRAGLLKSKVLIVGVDDMGKRTVHALKREPNLGYEVIGFIDENEPKTSYCIDGIRVHGHLQRIERYVKKCDIQDVVIASEKIDKGQLIHLINKLQHKVKNVLYIPDFSGMAVIGTELRHFFHDQMLALKIKNNLARPLNYFIKKLFDYTVSLILFFLLIIPILIISALIRLTSQGPAIFKQQRIGKDGEPFMCYKFRTMFSNADERLKNILITDPDARAEWQAYWKLQKDPRVTKIGNFLRKTSLDELPQIWNVLKGEMSLVGPRPYLPREWDALKEYSEIIHSVHPGITGLWQVSGRSDSSYEQRLSLDSWYVRNWNLWLDIVILIRTVFVVLKKEGAR
jgi:undecaprenyl-phosphate galactose phosphotransferase